MKKLSTRVANILEKYKETATEVRIVADELSRDIANKIALGLTDKGSFAFYNAEYAKHGGERYFVSDGTHLQFGARERTARGVYIQDHFGRLTPMGFNERVPIAQVIQFLEDSPRLIQELERVSTAKRIRIKSIVHSRPFFAPRDWYAFDGLYGTAKEDGESYDHLRTYEVIMDNGFTLRLVEDDFEFID